MRKKAIWVLAALLLFACLTGGCAEDAPIPAETQPTQTEPTVAEGYEILGGTWTVYGVYYNNRLVELSTIEALEQLYSGTLLSFSEDGTFLYCNPIFSEGNYFKKSDNTFMLKVMRSYRLDYVDGKVIEVESENPPTISYLVTLVEGSKMLRFAQMDPMTGREVTDTMPLLFAPAAE